MLFKSAVLRFWRLCNCEMFGRAAEPLKLKNTRLGKGGYKNKTFRARCTETTAAFAVAIILLK